ncbi:Abortive infection protein [Actinobacteria bacterium OK074]|nr:Abortive infection protein [Actinobacteria bacterium OK074]
MSDQTIVITPPRTVWRQLRSGSFTTAGAYTAVLGIYTAVAAPYLFSALGTVLGLYGIAVPAWWIHWPVGVWLEILGAGAAAVWLLALLDDSALMRQTGKALRIMGCVLLLAVAGADAQGWMPGPAAGVVGPAAEIGLYLWLAAEVCSSHGIAPDRWLARTPPRGRGRTATAESVQVSALAALVFSLTYFLLTALSHLPAPAPRQDQTTAASAGGMSAFLTQILWSAVVEEIVVTAAVATILLLARRPLWEILLASALMRALPHLYLGLSLTLGVVVLGVACAALYCRYRRILPLVAAHLAYDLATVYLGPWMRPLAVLCAWGAIATLAVLAVLSILTPASPARPGPAAPSVPKDLRDHSRETEHA